MEDKAAMVAGPDASAAKFGQRRRRRAARVGQSPPGQPGPMPARPTRIFDVQVWQALQRWLSASQIGALLAGVVLITGAIAFAGIGLLAELRLKRDFAEQAAAMEQLSRQTVARRLNSEALLAEARLDFLFEESSRQTRYLAQRLDIVKAVVSTNHVALQEILAPAAVTGELSSLLVTDANGTVRGANLAKDLLAATDGIAQLGLREAVTDVFEDNRRTARRAHRITLRLPEGSQADIGLQPTSRLVHAIIEPVFDDFGDVAGALIGLRALASSERTFDAFSGLSNAGVVIFDGNEAIVRGGPPAPGLLPAQNLIDHDLISTPDGGRVGRCVRHESRLDICTHVGVEDVKAAQEEILRISARQSRALFEWFLVIAAGSLTLLVAVVLVAVSRVTLGLPQLVAAAAAVAKGDLDIPFRATGIGEVHSLGQAFEVMLENLRKSLGRTQHLAFYDPVTGLANRQKMRLDGITALRSADRSIAFLFIDLDRFKSINDTFGHKAGDGLLRLLAGRLTSFFQMMERSGGISEHFVGRLGGDEFLAIIRGVPSEDDLRNVVGQLISVLSQSYTVGNTNMSVGASIGIAVADGASPTYDELLINADIAMYEAKRQGRNSFAFFTADAAGRVQDRLALEQDLSIALAERNLHVHYQPKVSLIDGSVKGAEALIRWHHPVRGDVSPGKFIGIAEESGLIQPLGIFVLERAIEEMGPLIRRGFDVTVSINVSALQLEDPSFAKTVAECLAAAAFPARNLEMEITETIAMGTSEVVHSQLSALRQSGIRFSIDDFGTGYSNLSNLARLKAETLKIDQSFVQGVHNNMEQQKIVRSILSLARSLGLETVVEGVESKDDLDFVVSEGADFAQGYYFSPAVAIEVFEAQLQPDRLRQNFTQIAPLARARQSTG